MKCLAEVANNNTRGTVLMQISLISPEPSATSVNVA